jgi:hypothetical protein
MSKTWKLIAGIVGAVIIILILTLIFNKCGTKKLQSDIDNKDGQIAILNEQVAMGQLNLKVRDSIWAIQKDSLASLKLQNAILVSRNIQITNAYVKIKSNVAKMTASESVKYFSDRTISFPTVLTLPDSNANVPIKAIKAANGLFVDLDKQIDLNGNLTQQNVSLIAQVANLDAQVLNRNGKIGELNGMMAIRTRQTELLTENIVNYQKLLKKETRKSVIYKITTVGGAIAIAVLLLK